MLIGHRRNRDTLHLWLAITILLVLTGYRASMDFSVSLRYFFASRTELPIAEWITNALFFWLLALLWIAYRRWLVSIQRRRELETVISSINPDALLVTEGEKISMCSEAVERMFGYTPEKILSIPLNVLLTSREQLYEESGEDMPQGFQVSHAIGRRQDGGTLWVEVIECRLHDNPGRVLLVRDIERWKRAESARKESESRYQLLLQNAAVGVIWFDREGVVKNANARIAEILGAAGPADVIGARLADRSLIVSANMLHKQLQTALADGVNNLFDEWVETAWGRTLCLDIHFAAMRDGAGEAIGIQAIVTDQTEQKQREEEFIQVQKMEAVGRLAGGVAHDFNNLLTVMLGYAELTLEQLHRGDPMYKNLSMIYKSATRAGELTKQLLAFSRRQRMPPRLIDVNRVLLDMDEMLRRLIGEDIELILLPAAEAATIKSDPGQMEQAILNLILNARDAIEDGGTIEIRIENTLLKEARSAKPERVPAGEYVCITVRDTGVGMDEHVAEHLFEPFFSTKGPERGTGLGLATVYGTVKDGAGYITLETGRECGSRFVLYFPRRHETADEALVRDDIGYVRGGDETLLLVEDEVSVREFMAAILIKHGYRVLEADNGVDALRVLTNEKQDVDLLVTDVVMPKMGGRELVQAVAKEQPDLRVLYVSGYSSNAWLRQELADVKRSFLPKPFSPQVLIRKVREVLDRCE